MQTDFTSLASTTLSFEKCQRLVCVSITIINDMMVEMPESFNVTLTRTANLDSRITLNPLQVDGVVRISDDDGKRFNLSLPILVLYNRECAKQFRKRIYMTEPPLAANIL